MKLIIIILFTLTLACHDLFGQDNASLIREQFEKWKATFPKHHIEVFFNQPKYSPGDTAYFNTFYLTEQSSRVQGRQILQASLFNCRGKLINHINFIVRDGVGFNQLVLPDTLKPGFYEVDLYSDWMKNFDPSFYCHQTLEVVDKNQIMAPPVSSEESLSFFPEGGSLVAGVTNRVIVIAREIPSTTASLIAGNGRLITTFSIDNSGVGVIVFTPEAGKTYSAYVNERLYSLPLPVTEKISVYLTAQQDRKPMKVVLGASPGSQLRNDDLSMLIISRGELYATAPVKFGDKEFVQFSVPQKDLPGGAAELWVLDSHGKPVACRLFPVADTLSVTATVTAAPNPVDTRGKIAAEITLTDNHGNPVEGEFSISVVSEQLFAAVGFSRSNTSGWSFNDIRPAQPQSFPEWDRWLITQSLGDYGWEKVFPGQINPHSLKNQGLGKTTIPELPTPVYPMSRYFHKRGIAFDLATGAPVSDSIKISAFFLKNTNGYESYTNKKGEFDFMFLFDLWESDELFYTAERKGIEQKNVRIKWLEENDHAPLSCAVLTDQPDNYAVFSSKRKAIERSYHFYTRPQRPEAIPDNPNAILEDELSGADVIVKIHDYLLFPTMAETLREIVPTLKHRIVNGKSVVRAYIDIESYVPTGDPLYVIDGVITRDTDFFLGLVPDDVLTIKIVFNHNKLRALGDIGKNGVVLVQTKNGDLAKLRSGTVISVVGMSRSVNYRAADHSQMLALRQPDFRSTIYWAPSVPTKGKTSLTFFAADNVGPVRIVIRGITKDGRLFKTSTQADIKFISTRRN